MGKIVPDETRKISDIGNSGDDSLSKADAGDDVPGLIQIISDPSRLQIMMTLSNNGAMCAKEILTHFSITQPTLSHHMNLLCSCGLVDSVKTGKFVRYRINKGGVHKLETFFANLILEKPENDLPKNTAALEPVKSPSLKKTPMLPTPKAVIPRPEIPEESILENKKAKKKDSKKDKKKKRKG